MSITSRLLRILGRRAFMTFGLVTFLVSALLATVNLTSRYALKVYVEDQLSRIPWDLAIYQRGGITGRDRLPAAVARVDGVTQVESLVFLRARFPEGGEVTTEVDGKPLTSPWMCLLAASDMSILPPQLALALERRGEGDVENGAVLALVGPERAMGGAFLALQGSKEFSVHVQVHEEKRSRLLFSTPLRGVIRLDRDELNRHLMDQTGSVSYIPYIGIILLMPHNPNVISRFDAVATGIMPLDTAGGPNADRGHIQLAEYEPEMVYLGKLQRDRLISGWDITGSLDRVIAVNSAVNDAAVRVALRAANEPEPQLLLVHDPKEPDGQGKEPGLLRSVRRRQHHRSPPRAHGEHRQTGWRVVAARRAAAAVDGMGAWREPRRSAHAQRAADARADEASRHFRPGDGPRAADRHRERRARSAASSGWSPVRSDHSSFTSAAAFPSMS